MPVSYVPVIVPFVVITIPILVGVIRGLWAGLLAGAVSAAIVATFLLSVFVPGWRLEAEANTGDPAAQYRLSMWYCMYPHQMDAVTIWPFRPDPNATYTWLEKAASQDYPPALYALGVSLKQGSGVPRPPNWTGPAGNCFRQPGRGQSLIDRALKLGYRPLVSEVSFLTSVFAERQFRDPYGYEKPGK